MKFSVTIKCSCSTLVQFYNETIYNTVIVKHVNYDRLCSV